MMPTEQKELQENTAIINRLIYGNWQTQVIYVYAELGIADILYKEPKSLDYIAETLHLHKDYLKRFLRCASNLGLLAADASTGLYSISERGKLLSSEHPYSKREEARLNGADYRYQPWGNLIKILKYGMSEEYSPTYKNGSLDYLKDKPEQLKTFHRAMSGISHSENAAIVKDYDFTAYSSVLDIGSGEGSFIKSILDKGTHLTGYMFDLKKTFDKDVEDKYKGRLFQKYGDFFHEIPDNADLYTMKNVIHNWPENKVIKLLENTRQAMLSQKNNATPPAKKRLLIVENIVPENDEDSIAAWMDLNFMILIDGAERTLSEYRQLGSKCGLALTNTFKTDSGRHILEYALA